MVINPLFFGSIGAPEVLVILLIVLLLFGAKRIPEIAQGLGKGIREFKKSMQEVQDEIEKPRLVKDSKANKDNKEETEKKEDEKND